jgi:glyoxylase-like metal-dependent hydrolase (beta-lactamase superfamily II)
MLQYNGLIRRVKAIMKYEFSMQADNVYVIDTKMFGFDNYMSAYLVQGKELALIDTGLPNQLEAVRAGIKAHGFSISDISYIFVTHAHEDHSGNAGPLLRESPKANVYINPAAFEFLTKPSIEEGRRGQALLAKMNARFGKMEPVPPSRIRYLKDSDIFDLGNGTTLKITFTAGHQPSGMVILEEKNRGLFINDLVGNYFPDCDYLQILAPIRSDMRKAMELLRKVMTMPVKRLFLGHFGICDKPTALIQRALDGMQQLMDIGAQCMAAGKPEEIEPRVLAVKKIEVEKIRARGERVYEHESEELITHQSKYFADYYQELCRQNKLAS